MEKNPLMPMIQWIKNYEKHINKEKWILKREREKKDRRKVEIAAGDKKCLAPFSHTLKKLIMQFMCIICVKIWPHYLLYINLFGVLFVNSKTKYI